MDILSCLVGVMLFLVIYTVLELGSAAYQAEVVVSRARIPGTERVLVVANGGTVRVLDVRPALERLLQGFEIVQTPEEVPVFVESVGEAPADASFTYDLRSTARSTADIMGLLDLAIEERPGAVGDSIHELGPGSSYARSLDALDPTQAWIAFAVDTASGDVFRRAREMAIERGFATGFDELEVAFPMSLALSREGLDDLFSPITASSKPLR
jgi:hypothetical protein